MTIDPEKFGAWTARIFAVGVAIVIVATLIREFLILNKADPVVVGGALSLSVIPLAGPAAARLMKGRSS